MANLKLPSNKNEILQTRKRELLSELQYFENRIVELKNAKQHQSFEYESSDSELEFKINTGPSISILKQQQETLQTCLQATQELTDVSVLQSEVNVLVKDPEFQGEPPVLEDGVWQEVVAECRIDLVPFCISFYSHLASRHFGPVSYRGLQVNVVKKAHELEMNRSVLPSLRRPADVIELVRSYAAAHRSRRTSLAKLEGKFGDALLMEPMAEGGYIIKCADLLEISWTLQNKCSCIAPFHHRLKFDLEYMDESYIKIITHTHKQLSDPLLETDERTLLLAKIINTCLEAQKPTQELHESLLSDPESVDKLKKTTLDRDIDVPNAETHLMAPPKCLTKKSKGKENLKRPSDDSGSAAKKFKSTDKTPNDNALEVSNTDGNRRGNESGHDIENVNKAGKRSHGNKQNRSGNKKKDSKETAEVPDENQGEKPKNIIKMNNVKDQKKKRKLPQTETNKKKQVDNPEILKEHSESKVVGQKKKKKQTTDKIMKENQRNINTNEPTNKDSAGKKKLVGKNDKVKQKSINKDKLHDKQGKQTDKNKKERTDGNSEEKQNVVEKNTRTQENVKGGVGKKQKPTVTCSDETVADKHGGTNITTKPNLTETNVNKQSTKHKRADQNNRPKKNAADENSEHKQTGKNKNGGTKANDTELNSDSNKNFNNKINKQKNVTNENTKLKHNLNNKNSEKIQNSKPKRNATDESKTFKQISGSVNSKIIPNVTEEYSGTNHNAKGEYSEINSEKQNPTDNNIGTTEKENINKPTNVKQRTAQKQIKNLNTERTNSKLSKNTGSKQTKRTDTLRIVDRDNVIRRSVNNRKSLSRQITTSKIPQKLSSLQEGFVKKNPLRMTPRKKLAKMPPAVLHVQRDAKCTNIPRLMKSIKRVS